MLVVNVFLNVEETFWVTHFTADGYAFKLTSWSSLLSTLLALLYLVDYFFYFLFFLKKVISYSSFTVLYVVRGLLVVFMALV